VVARLLSVTRRDVVVVEQAVQVALLDSSLMALESLVLIPKCAECEAVWLPADEARWQAWLTDDEPPELAFYCPDCAEREFGSG
jgi:hypothetical protein